MERLRAKLREAHHQYIVTGAGGALWVMPTKLSMGPEAYALLKSECEELVDGKIGSIDEFLGMVVEVDLKTPPAEWIMSLEGGSDERTRASES